MRPIGFSTGALARDQFRDGLGMAAAVRSPVVELSALRERELEPLMTALRDLDLSAFRYVSVHAPSRFSTMSERDVAIGLLPCIERGLPVVIHPDVIVDPSCWKAFGALLCIENMDKRKRTGRTVDEMAGFFETFPDATFCLDMAHARQIDPTMIEARQLLKRFGHRLRQVHVSEIDSAGSHHRLSVASVYAGQRVASLIGDEVPIVIESMTPLAGLEEEMRMAERALARRSPEASSPETCRVDPA